MAKSPNTPGTDVVPPHWIAPGISFTNPGMSRTASKVRNVPWMMPAGWRPLSVLSQGYPNATNKAGNDRQMMEDKQLKIRKPYWRRRFKNNAIVRMGHNFREVPSFEEVGLGESVSQTSAPAPVAETGFWGNVTSLLTTAGSIWQQSEARKLQQKVAVEQVRVQALTVPASLSANTTMLAVGIGTAVLGYMFLSKRG